MTKIKYSVHHQDVLQVLDCFIDMTEIAFRILTDLRKTLITKIDYNYNRF